MVNLANLKKTWYYLQKNGIANTYYAVKERVFARSSELYPDKNYRFLPVSEQELTRQRETTFEKPYKFSILVPAYETNPVFAKAMIDSVLAQSYPYLELILADASKSDVVEKVVKSYDDERIIYHRLGKNDGISQNTNEALAFATGDYTGLLDHDDLLTPDALFEMADCLEQARRKGKTAAFVYSDEDKCDTGAEKYYEPNIKPAFNPDLLFSNNYICHFLVMKTELMKSLGFRKEYDGAQDFDLVLRAALHKKPEDEILHVGKVLYHWRCHNDSTAANPRSKQYAYEAGKRAVEDAVEVFLGRMHGETDTKASGVANSNAGAVIKNEKGLFVNGVQVKVVHTKHNGFYRVVYGAETAEDIFAVRKDIGIVAGSVKKGNKITGGIKNKDGKCPFDGLYVKFSGYLHRNVLAQDCEQADLDNASVRKELLAEITKNNKINPDLTKEQEQICILTREKGYRILYDPLFEKGKA